MAREKCNLPQVTQDWLDWAVFSEEDIAAVGIRNLREVNNAERDVVRVRRWSIVPRIEGAFGPGETLTPAGRTQPPAGYRGLVGIGYLDFEEDVVAVGIRNLTEIKNAERDIVRVRRWSIVPRRIQRGRFGRGRFFLMTAAYGL